MRETNGGKIISSKINYDALNNLRIYILSDFARQVNLETQQIHLVSK